MYHGLSQVPVWKTNFVSLIDHSGYAFHKNTKLMFDLFVIFIHASSHFSPPKNGRPMYRGLGVLIEQRKEVVNIILWSNTDYSDSSKYLGLIFSPLL